MRCCRYKQIVAGVAELQVLQSHEESCYETPPPDWDPPSTPPTPSPAEVIEACRVPFRVSPADLVGHWQCDSWSMRFTVWKNGGVQRFVAAKTGYVLDKGDASVIRWSGLGIIKYEFASTLTHIGRFADEAKNEIILRSCDAPLTTTVSWVKLF